MTRDWLDEIRERLLTPDEDDWYEAPEVADVQRLVAEVERLRAENEELRASREDSVLFAMEAAVPEDHADTAPPEGYTVLCELRADEPSREQLRAEVERLRRVEEAARVALEKTHSYYYNDSCVAELQLPAALRALAAALNAEPEPGEGDT